MTIHLSQAKPSVDIITLGCEDNLQKRNVLKGLALQKLVKSVMQNSEEDISLRKIFESLTEQQEEYFIINKPFKTQNNRYFKRWKFVHLTDFNDYLEIWLRTQQISKEWKVCSFCGQRIKASEQFSKKCWKCKKGWYKISSTKKDVWKLKFKGQRDCAITYLLEKGFLKAISLKKRLDFFHYANNEFIIFEAKNKEKTGLNLKDIQKTLIYPYIVTRCGYQVNSLYLIFNGKITKELKRSILRGYGKDLPFKFELLPISLFLAQRNFNIKTIKVLKENKKYTYQLIPGVSRKLTIDLTEIAG